MEIDYEEAWMYTPHANSLKWRMCQNVLYNRLQMFLKAELKYAVSITLCLKLVFTSANEGSMEWLSNGFTVQLYTETSPKMFVLDDKVCATRTKSQMQARINANIFFLSDITINDIVRM